jgi:hypothetical protein
MIIRRNEYTFQSTQKDCYLWLVVSGAPSEHWEHLSDQKDENDEQCPCQIKLSRTSQDDAMINSYHED